MQARESLMRDAEFVVAHSVGMQALGPGSMRDILYSVLTDIRRIAIVICIARIIAGIAPALNSIQSIRATLTDHPKGIWAVLAFTPVAILFDLISTGYFYVVYRNPTPPIFKRFRVALFCGGTIALGQLFWSAPGLAEFLYNGAANIFQSDWPQGGSSAVTALVNAGAFGLVSTVANVISQITFILFLAALFRRASVPADPEVSLSPALRKFSLAAAIAWGIWIGFGLWRLMMIPSLYGWAQKIAPGDPRASLGRIFASILPSLLSGIAMFLAPYVIFRSICEAERRESISPLPAEAEGSV